MKTHLYLVSAQSTPNLTPAMDPLTRPEKVVLLVSPDMRRRAQWLATVLRPRGIMVEEWTVEDAWDVEQIQTRVLELIECERDSVAAKQFVLNATGGTKPMSIAAYEAFRAYELPIFYVHPEQDRLIWMYPYNRKPTNLADRIRLEAFLQAHGAGLEAAPRREIPDAAGLELAQRIVQDLGRFSAVLPKLNWLAYSANKTLKSKPVENDYGALAELIDLFDDIGYLSRSHGHLRFASEQARFLVNGGWIEGYVFDAVRRLKRQDVSIQDAAYSIEVLREQRGRSVPNELDVAFLRDNRLHVIECKTRRFVAGGEDSPGAEALYKLDTLRDLMGGLKARAMLVSYLDLPDHDRTRAADLKIAVCAGTDLRRLDEYLKKFIA